MTAIAQIRAAELAYAAANAAARRARDAGDIDDADRRERSAWLEYHQFYLDFTQERKGSRE